MGRMRPVLIAAMLGAAALLAMPAVIWAHLVTADLNGHGVRDRVEAGPVAAELSVHLSNSTHARQLRAGTPVLGIVFADVDRDADADLIVLVAVAQRPGLRVWTTVGRGRFVPHAPRDALETGPPAAKRVTIPPPLPPDDDDASGDASGPFILASVDLRGRAAVGVLLPPIDAPGTSRARLGRRDPRGPPTTLRFS